MARCLISACRRITYYRFFTPRRDDIRFRPVLHHYPRQVKALPHIPYYTFSYQHTVTAYFAINMLQVGLHCSHRDELGGRYNTAQFPHAWPHDRVLRHDTRRRPENDSMPLDIFRQNAVRDSLSDYRKPAAVL